MSRVERCGVPGGFLCAMRVHGAHDVELQLPWSILLNGHFRIDRICLHSVHHRRPRA